jgi:hypothetical protein
MVADMEQRPGALASWAPGMSRYQNSGSQSAAGTRRPRRGGRVGAPVWSAAWTAAATSRAVSASMTMFRRSSMRRTTCPACGGASCGPMTGSVTPGTVEETNLAGCRTRRIRNAFYKDRRAAPARPGALPVIMSPTDSRQAGSQRTRRRRRCSGYGPRRAGTARSGPAGGLLPGRPGPGNSVRSGSAPAACHPLWRFLTSGPRRRHDGGAQLRGQDLVRAGAAAGQLAGCCRARVVRCPPCRPARRRGDRG